MWNLPYTRSRPSAGGLVTALIVAAASMPTVKGYQEPTVQAIQIYVDTSQADLEERETCALWGRQLAGAIAARRGVMRVATTRDGSQVIFEFRRCYRSKTWPDDFDTLTLEAVITKDKERRLYRVSFQREFEGHRMVGHLEQELLHIPPSTRIYADAVAQPMTDIRRTVTVFVDPAPAQPEERRLCTEWANAFVTAAANWSERLVVVGNPEEAEIVFRISRCIRNDVIERDAVLHHMEAVILKGDQSTPFQASYRQEKGASLIEKAQAMLPNVERAIRSLF